MKEFQLSQAIAGTRYVPNFFSHHLCTDGQILLANGRNVYIRSEAEDEWLRCFTYDSPIVGIYPSAGSKNQDARIVTVTQSSVETLKYDSEEKALVQGQSQAIPGRVEGSRYCDQKWGYPNVLIMTCENPKNQSS